MNKIKIKELRGEEIDPILELTLYAFYQSPSDIEQLTKLKPYFKEDLCLALYEDEKLAAGLMLKPIPQNVRGIIKPMCGVAEVVTYPEARRKGFAKQLMELSFSKMKEQKQVFSMLYPFKESFYERLGYITFPQLRTAVFSPKTLTPLLKLNLDGKVERVNIKEGFSEYLNFIKKYQKQTHGMGIKHDTEQERLRENPRFWLVIATDNSNEIVGIMTCVITGFWKEIKIRHFYYTKSLGKYLLLQWLAHHADQVNEVHLPVYPFEHPEIWVNDTFWGSNGKIISREWVPSCMGRVILVDQLSGLDVGSGEISIQIKDDNCEWNNKSFLFKAVNGKLEVSETNNYDCQLSIQGLSAIIYGCYNLDDFEFKKWGKISSEHKKVLEGLFPKLLPYLHADF